MLQLSLNGIKYKGFDESFVERNIEKAASTFGFSAATKGGRIIPIREGDLVEVYADNTLVLTGYIDEYEVNYDEKSHNISIKGRSKTQDFVDSTVPSIKEWEDYSLYNLIKTLADHFGVIVVDEANVKDVLQNVIGAELGQTCFEFVEQFCRRRQALLTDNANGDIVITKPNFELFPVSLRNEINGNSNNIKSARRYINMSELFGVYIANIQGYPLDASEFTSADQLLLSADFVIDDEIRSTRYYEFYAEEVITIDTIDSVTALKERAQWEMGIRRARNFKYETVLSGHSIFGNLFKNNMLYQIEDDFANIHGQFFCNKIRYEYSSMSGSTTKLNFTNKNSYTLQSESDKILLTDD